MDTIKFSFRGDADDIARVDQLAKQYGFKTRTKYLLHAGLHFHEQKADDDIMAKFARLVYSVRQIERGTMGLPFLLKQDDVKHIRRDVTRTMAQVLDKIR